MKLGEVQCLISLDYLLNVTNKHPLALEDMRVEVY